MLWLRVQLGGFVSFTNGHVVYNPARVEGGGQGAGQPQCVDAQGQEVMCCVWQVRRACQHGVDCCAAMWSQGYHLN